MIDQIIDDTRSRHFSLTILGVEGYNRMKNWIKRKKE
jgi:hypothetical protein